MQKTYGESLGSSCTDKDSAIKFDQIKTLYDSNNINYHRSKFYFVTIAYISLYSVLFMLGYKHDTLKKKKEKEKMAIVAA